jgi:ABC-2 type transport system ATP-binding protein
VGPCVYGLSRGARRVVVATAIEVEHLTKTFPGKLAVDDISFSIEQGQVVGFLGPNGAGKTTTIRILTCFTPATHGRASVMGFDVFDQSLEVRKRVGYLPEATPVYPEMRVEEYLRYRARLKGVSRGDIKKSVTYAMERTQIHDVRRQIIGQLSKGYRQRVGLADALVASPPILILDEPTIGLDPNQIRQTRSLIRELGEDHTVFLSTHILPEVEQVCDRVLIIHRGRIGGEGTPSDLRERVSQGVRLRVEARGQSPSVITRDIEAIEGITNVEVVQSELDGKILKSSEVSEMEPDDFRDVVTQLGVLAANDAEIREDIFFAATDGEWVIRELATDSMSLEEVFAHLTSEEDERGDADEDDAEEDSDEAEAGSDDDDEEDDAASEDDDEASEEDEDNDEADRREA